LYTDTSIEWNPKKARLNLRKHGVQFADAGFVLEDANARTLNDEGGDGEQRWITIGVDSLGRVLVVVYTWRGDRIRLIPVRPATPRERHKYEEGL
jgi:uncharacterized DUF497 family protein